MAEDSSSAAALSASDQEIQDTKPCTRGHWRPSEDDRLRQLVEKFGAQNWNSIAEKLQGRTGKSCRLRWFNQLDPKINRMPFTQEEEEMLVMAHNIHGNKWAQIARLFPGRTDNAVKNHWHVLAARRKREQSRAKRNFDDLYYDINSSSSSSNNNNSFPYHRGAKQPHEELSFGSSRNGGLDNARILDFSSPPNSLAFPNFGSNMASLRKDMGDFNFNNTCSNAYNPNASSIGGFHGSTLSTLPNYNRVVDDVPSCFGNLDAAAADDDDDYGRMKSDYLVSFCDNSSTLTRLRASSSTEQEQAEESSSNDHNVERNKVPFIDFLGVGASSP